MSYLQKLKNEESRGKVWLVVEWKSSSNVHDGYSLISSDDLADNLQYEDFHTGKLINVKANGGVKQACIVIVSADKPFLEMEIKHLQEAVQQIGLNKRSSSQQKSSSAKRRKASTSQIHIEPEQSDQDFVESASDWSPSAGDESEPEKVPSKGKGKSRKSAAPNSSNQKKRNNRKDKKQESVSKSKKKHPEHNGKTVVTSVARLLSRQSEPISLQAVSTPSEMKQYQVLDRVVTPHTSVIYNGPRSRQSYAPSPTEYYKVPPMTFDQQTQTNLSNSDPNTILLHENQKVMGDDISYLHKIIEEMGLKMNSMQLAIEQLQYERQNGVTGSRNDLQQEDYLLPHEEQAGPSVLRDSNKSNLNDSIENVNNSDKDPYAFSGSPPLLPQSHGLPPNNVHNKHFINHNNVREPTIINMDGTDMVPIGSGKTLVSRHIYNQIQWNSYSNATRKLLMAVFPRRTLATHSLTGKSSPAFNNKPAKMQLDAKKVTDIIMTVSLMSNTPENLVRNVITTKCADENKMYRVRMEKNEKRKNNASENEENQSP